MPARACVQQSGEHVRAALIRQGVIQAVIALPRSRTSRTALWILRRPHASDQAAGPGPVTMIDLSGLAGIADVPRDHAAWQRLLVAPDPATTRQVPRLHLLGEAASLLPARYLPLTAQPAAKDLNQSATRLGHLYARAARALPHYAPARGRPRLAPVTLAELERAGALTIRPRDATPRPGDVLLRTQGRPPAVAAGTAADDTGVAQVVEINEARLDPHFVAAFLATDVAALPVANTLGAINRDDLRRCRIPRMPLAEQRRYGDAFRHLEQLDATLQALAGTSAKIIEQMVHGLTAGTLAPDRTEGETGSQ
jgi:hypothetical protein